MTRITVRMNAKLLAQAQDLADARSLSLNQLLCELVENEVASLTGDKPIALFELADRAERCSIRGPLTRNQAHCRR
jgi:hypothetical protein